MIRRTLGLGMLLAAVAAPAAQAEVTTCAFGGPTGTERHMRLHLPAGAQDLTLTLDAAAQTGGLDRASRHLSVGLLVVDLATNEVVAHRVYHQGVNPRRVAVLADATGSLTVDAPGPGVPFEADGQEPVPGLPPGDYGVVAFGSDGGAALPNPFWSATITVSGRHTCETRGSTRVIDRDTTDATSGTAVAAGPALYADAAQVEADLGGDLVVGLLSAFGGAGSEASVTFDHPSRDGVVDNALVPFASDPGAFSWQVDALGPAAAVDIVGVEVTW
jgi:hypothetical protein